MIPNSTLPPLFVSILKPRFGTKFGILYMLFYKAVLMNSEIGETAEAHDNYQIIFDQDRKYDRWRYKYNYRVTIPLEYAWRVDNCKLSNEKRTSVILWLFTTCFFYKNTWHRFQTAYFLFLKWFFTNLLTQPSQKHVWNDFWEKDFMLMSFFCVHLK